MLDRFDKFLDAQFLEHQLFGTGWGPVELTNQWSQKLLSAKSGGFLTLAGGTLGGLVHMKDSHVHGFPVCSIAAPGQ